MKEEKTTKQFSYYLDQIPCDYTVDMMNKFKGLDLTDIVPE